MSAVGERFNKLRQELKELTATFREKTKAKEEELLKFQKENNIQIRPLSQVQRSAK